MKNYAQQQEPRGEYHEKLCPTAGIYIKSNQK